LLDLTIIDNNQRDFHPTSNSNHETSSKKGKNQKGVKKKRKDEVHVLEHEGLWEAYQKSST
jgi:hypothetical protein